ncbi:MAG: NAD(P)/FAD-dependent oxidoreductase [Anaerolineae bacterium]|jgi:phytoene dehydrogenase-like protein|nr:NAD(P)/FAD-dependent oxidoreductase [Anaerolineae bacterium]
MRKRNQVHNKVVVIGAGLSGLTAAAYLAKAGYPVTLYEQADEIGGVTATLRESGYAWDLGPLLVEGLAPDERGGHILKDLGIADQVGLKMGNRGYVFPDFSLWRPESYEGPNWRRERLKALFPAERASIDAYYTFYNRMLNVVALNVRADVAREPRKSLVKMQLWRAYNRVRQREAWSAQKLMDHYFVDKRLKAIFTSILADFVARPSTFPGLAVPVLNVENSFDQRIPRRLSNAGRRPSYQFVADGCGSLVKALGTALRRNGVRIYTNATVEKILVEGDRVRGVELAGGHVELADIVIASGGARETFLKLVGREYLTADFAYLVDELELMESVLMVHLGVDMDPRPFQPDPLGYYYGTYDIETSVAACRRGEYHEGADGFVLYFPSMHSPAMAPRNQHSITIYTIAPNELSEGTWQSRKHELAGKLVAYAENVIPDLRDHVRAQIILTPEDFRGRTHQDHHAFGGRVPVLGQDAPGYETPVKGLWFIGSQSKSGGGIQNVMVGARDAARLIRAHPKGHF